MPLPTRLAMVVALGLVSPARTCPVDEPGAAYRALLEKAKADPDSVDFAELRRAFARTDAYSPRSTEEFDPSAVEHERKNGERAAALQALDQALAGFWVDPRAQLYAFEVCGRLGEEERARMHRRFLQKILEAILKDRDGRSFEQAWPVLSVREEYLILEAHDLDRPHTQSLVEHEGHHYDIHTFRGEDDAQELRLYFNIDVPHGWLREHLPSRP
jgi:hypothetical protein